jgi:hypothetical protein
MITGFPLCLHRNKSFIFVMLCMMVNRLFRIFSPPIVDYRRFNGGPPVACGGKGRRRLVYKFHNQFSAGEYFSFG